MQEPPYAAVRVAGLSYRYPDGRHALRGVDFAISPGETVALVGPNGAGKSTLLLHLNGLLPDRAGSPVHDHDANGHRDAPPRRGAAPPAVAALTVDRASAATAGRALGSTGAGVGNAGTSGGVGSRVRASAIGSAPPLPPDATGKPVAPAVATTLGAA